MGASLTPCGLAGVMIWKPRARVAVAMEFSEDKLTQVAGNVSEQTRPISFHKKYELTRRLGKGAFATVYSVSDTQRGQADLAAKVVELAGSDLSKEIEILQKVSQLKYCIGLVDYFLEGDFGYIVMERCDMEFYDLLCSEANLSERSFVPFAHHMFEALAAIHDLQIIHRDVKFDNFLFNSRSRVLKLCDFGMSEVLTPEEPFAKGFRGTTPFMSPEMLRREPYSVQTDVWSVGVMMYTILLGEFPYMPSRSGSTNMVSMITTNVPVPSFRPASAIRSPSGASIDLLHKLIKHDPLKRVKSKEILNDGWFNVAETSDHSGHSMMHTIISAKRIGAFSLPKKGGIDPRLMTLQSASRGSGSFFPQFTWCKHTSLASTVAGSDWSDDEDVDL